MDKIVNCDPTLLDLSKAKRVEFVSGIEATMAPNRITGDMEIAILHLDDIGGNDVVEYVEKRAASLIQEAAKGGEEKDFHFFELPPPSDALNRDRMIQVTEFDEWSRDRFITDLMRLDSENPSKPIVIMITSTGGLIHALFGMLGFAQIVQAPVYTVVVDMAYSCGALLAAAAAPKGNRFVTEYGEIMVHELFAGAFGQMPDIEAQVEDIKRVNDRLFEILGNVTEKTQDEWGEIVRNKDNKRNHYYFADDAIELGLVDQVLRKEDYPQLFVKE